MTDEPTSAEPRSGRTVTDGPSGIGDAPAGVLVFFASAAVLVVELVALRLLAPYLGLTLETNTIVIGIALGAIALGSWAGGREADRLDPRRALAPLLALSGIAVAATPFAVRLASVAADGAFLLLASAATIIVPGTLLSAVTPMVTKLRLTSLSATGTVVGTLSGIGTAGSIVGTVVTGFVLISAVPVTWILVGLGILLVLSAAVIEIGIRRAGPASSAALGTLALLAVAGLGSAVVPDDCDAETTYHCASVVADPQRPTGRVLVLDALHHSYVDVEDPTHLEFSYVRAFAAAIEARFPDGEALDAHHIGGGGLTLPRYLDHTRPGTRSTVSEIDPGVVEIDREHLGLTEDENLQVRIEDGRVGLRALPSEGLDLVVGDAFGGVSVPWHLTTREAVADIERVLAPDGLYVVNLIDHDPLDFARAELATLQERFDHVALASAPETVAGPGGGNLVAIASNAPLDTAAWTAQMDRREVGWQVVQGAELTAWIGDAPVLTDDYAPVDQLLTPYGQA